MDYTAYPCSFNSGNSDENPEIMRWLSPLDSRRGYQDVRTERLDDVGNSHLETNEFREWRSGEGGVDKAVLFCYGSPGVGKTFLRQVTGVPERRKRGLSLTSNISSLVIDRLYDEAGGGDIAVAGFYCDFRNQDEQTTTNIIGAILKQLVAREDMLEHVRTAFKKAKQELGGRGLRLPDMVQMVKRAVATLPQVFICIDALDQCLSKYLSELLGSLRDILQESPRMRIFVTGRPHVEVEIIRHFAAAIIVPISPSAHEIRRYLEKKLEKDTMRDAMSDDLRADILRIIPERISEMCVEAFTVPTLC